MMHKVRVLDYEPNQAGRIRFYTKKAVVDLSEVEYMESDHVPEYGDCVIVRLRSGKEFTVIGTVEELHGYMSK